MSYVKRLYIGGEKVEKQLKNPVKGIVCVIGNYGTGKTTFALENGYHPKDMIFINDNVKAVPFQDEFKRYVDLTELTKGMKLLDQHKRCLKLVDELQSAKVIIWDTWTRFAGTFGPYVIANPLQFRDKGQYAPKGDIKTAEMYKDAYAYEGQILNKLKDKCDLLIITFHLKNYYLNNMQIPGKQIPGNDRSVTEYSDLRLWLMNNPNSSIPTGIVLKNIAKYDLTDNGSIEASQVLPQRLAVANWKNIFQYWKKPIGNREPTEDEKPSELEMSLIDGTLTAEEKALYEASIQYVERLQSEENELLEAANKAVLIKAVQQLNGKPPMAILQQVKSQIEAGTLNYDGEITMKDIADIIKETK